LKALSANPAGQAEIPRLAFYQFRAKLWNLFVDEALNESGI
jgi:hypothetical protein